MDQVMQFVEPSRQFVKDSIRLVKRCTKPDRKGKTRSKADHDPYCVLYITICLSPCDLFVVNVSQLPIQDLNWSSCPVVNGFAVLDLINFNVSFPGTYSIRCVRVVLKITL